MLDLLLNLTITLISFIVLLSFIVFFHELGHFQVARWCGVKVDVFSIGFGKTLFSRTDKHGTNWRISALPLGGYVKFFGDASAASNPSAEISAEKQGKAEGLKGHTTNEQFSNKSEKERLEAALTPEEKAVCFHFKPLWQRSAVVAAGPIANFILAVVILTFIFSIFGEQVTRPVVGEVIEGGAAAEAGFEAGDIILSMDGKEVKSFRQLQRVVSLSTGESLEFVVERDGGQVTLSARPRREEREDAFGNTVRTGYLGLAAAPAMTQNKEYGLFGAVGRSVKEVGDILGTTVVFLKRIILGKEDIRMMGGPVKIAKYAGQATTVGFSEDVPEDTPLQRRLMASATTFFWIAAMISISVGFLNLLPIPVLDGGHLVFYAWEAVAGEPLSENIQALSFKIGIVLMLSLMVFVTWNDVTQEIFSR